jgi:cytochrome c biogenesis protein CcmG/thiol:disulfide interchange protein DsbE
MDVSRVHPRFRTVLALTAAAALIGAGCGSSSPAGEETTAPDYDRALAGAPPPLAALHAEANELLGGGVDAYEARVARLTGAGYPVVANVWASWCGPCRIEIPYFQRAAARYGKWVGFLGIDRQDSDDAALTFLREEPVPYPSYRDPDEAISVSIGAELGMPDTAFYDSSGELTYLKQGPYETIEELVADIRRYALAGGGAESG